MSENWKYLYLGAIIIVSPIFFIFNALFSWLWLKFHLPLYYPVTEIISLPASALAGILYILGIIFLLKNEKISSFGTEIIVELKKVTWPSWEESKGSTIIVLIVVLFFAVFLGISDIILLWAVKLLMGS